MQPNNPLQMNDREIEKIFKVVIHSHPIRDMWGAIGLDAIGLHIPILREHIGFIYPSCISGALIPGILDLINYYNISQYLMEGVSYE